MEIKDVRQVTATDPLGEHVNWVEIKDVNKFLQLIIREYMLIGWSLKSLGKLFLGST